MTLILGNDHSNLRTAAVSYPTTGDASLPRGLSTDMSDPVDSGRIYALAVYSQRRWSSSGVQNSEHGVHTRASRNRCHIRALWGLREGVDLWEDAGRIYSRHY